MFFSQLLLGAILVCITVVFHAWALDQVMRRMRLVAPLIRLYVRGFWRVPVLSMTVLLVFCAHITEIWFWAGFYLASGALDNLESALYFSTTAFSTVGFGDVVLSHEWRLISSFQGANGFMLFGWSTAFIFEIMSKLYDHQAWGLVQRD